jgi:hypothetical protein
MFLRRLGATHQLLHGIAQAPISMLSISIIGTIKVQCRNRCASFSLEAGIPLKIFEMRVVEDVNAISCSLGPICFRSSDCISWPWRGLGLSLRVAVDRSSCHSGVMWLGSWLMWEL